MLDDYRSDDGVGFDGRQQRGRRANDDRFADREVPLPLEAPVERVFSPAIHAWLDGELPEAAVRKGDTARDVEFWNRLNDEAERRRRMQTPAHLEARIMAALPQSAPQVITPWFRREFVVTPASAVAVVAGLIALTAIVTIVLMQFAG